MSCSDIHHLDEEDFFFNQKREQRKERKRLQRKDRSHHRKSNCDQREKQEQKERDNGSNEDNSLLQGVVSSIHSETIQVDCRGSRYFCLLRGSLKKKRTQRKNLLVTGDRVFFSPSVGTKESSVRKGFIFSVAPRKSVLARTNNLSQKHEQLMAANVDQVFITLSVGLPPLNPHLVDRYLLAAKRGNITPIVLVNKSDLLPYYLKEKKLWKEFSRAYSPLFSSPIILISVHTGEGIDALLEMMREKISLFSGQSGVGKSSLINCIRKEEQTLLPTGQVIKKNRKGSHTTTRASLIPTKNGGWCIDSPGIRSFGLWKLSAEEIRDSFEDFVRISVGNIPSGKKGKPQRGCKYPDCFHIEEPDCAVRRSIIEKEISPLRYQSYLALLESQQKKYLRR